MFGKGELELIGVIFAYLVVYVLVIDPIYGLVIGIGEPLLSMLFGARHRFSWATNVRAWLMIFSGAFVLVGYMYLKAKLAGENLGEHWNDKFGT